MRHDSENRIAETQVLPAIDWADEPQPQVGAGGGARPPRPRRGQRRAAWPAARRPRRRALWIALGAVLVVGMTLMGSGIYLVSHLNSNVQRIKGVFDGVPENERPAKVAGAEGSLNILLAGSDSRYGEAGDVGTNDAADAPGSGLTDAIMVLHIAADRRSAAVVSLPRDSWVPIPGKGNKKINAAYPLGGPSLLIRTVEAVTGNRIDHFAIVDFDGFQGIVNAVGGVDVPVAADNGRVQTQHMNGTQALTYVRERHSLPRGDLDRQRRQQNLIRAVMAKAATLNPGHDPIATYKLLDAGTRSVRIDDRFSTNELRTLAVSLSSLNTGAVSFLTAPVKGLGHEGDQSVVYLDSQRCAELWNAVRSDRMVEYVAGHKTDILPAAPA